MYQSLLKLSLKLEPRIPAIELVGSQKSSKNDHFWWFLGDGSLQIHKEIILEFITGWLEFLFTFPESYQTCELMAGGLCTISIKFVAILTSTNQEIFVLSLYCILGSVWMLHGSLIDGLRLLVASILSLGKCLHVFAWFLLVEVRPTTDFWQLWSRTCEA